MYQFTMSDLYSISFCIRHVACIYIYFLTSVRQPLTRMRLLRVEHMALICISLFAAVSCVYGESRKHTFIANTNFENPTRWEDDSGSHQPCAGDRILFSPDDVISVFVQSGTTISEMVLPLNGEFVFGDGFVWGVSNDLTPCSHIDHSHDVSFNSAPDSWFRPSNWQPSSQDVTTPVESQDILDIAKIPCDFDDVVFPASSSSTTEIELPVTTRSLQIAEKTFATESFSEYRKSEGRYRFIGSGQVTILEDGCQDPTGCLCRDLDNLEAVFNAICGYIECDQPACENPIMGYGSCCERCASMLVFNYTDQYTESSMRDFIHSISSKAEYSGTHTVLSKITSQMLLSKEGTTDEMMRFTSKDVTGAGLAIQIYVTDDSGNGERAKALANAYYNELKSPNNELGVSVITMETSGAIISHGLDVGAIAGIVVGSIFGVLLIAIMLYGCRSAPFFGGKKYNMEFELDDGSNVANITEVGPGEEFESSDYDSRRMKANQMTSTVNIGWPQRSAMESDFGVSFGNPAFEEHDL